MNAKHLFLTLAMLLASISFVSASYVYDNISYTNATANYPGVEEYPTYNDVTDCDFFAGVDCDARYVGSFFYSSSYESLGICDYAFGTQVSGGIARRVTVTWDTDNATDGDVITLCAKMSPYALDDDDPASSSASNWDIEYTDGVGVSVFDTFDDDYTHIAFIAPGTAWVKSIEVKWEVVEPLTPHHVLHGTIDGEDANMTWGKAIVVDKTEVEDVYEDDVVTITFDASYITKGYRLDSYSFDDMEFDLDCFGYLARNEDDFVVRFPMPADRNVTISAKFVLDDRDVPTIKAVYDEDGSKLPSLATLNSGVEKTLGVKLSKAIDGVKFDVTVADPTKAKFVESYLSGDTGTITLKGLAIHTAKPWMQVTIKTPKTALYKSATKTCNFQVLPREVALVAEKSGSYYVMNNTVSAGGVATATEVSYCAADGIYYYDESTLNIDLYTWNIAEPDEDEYTIQNPNNDNKFLQVSKEKLKEDAASYSWYKDYSEDLDGLFHRGGFSIVTNGTNFSAKSTLDNAAKEALIGRGIRPFGSYSTVSGAEINDVRSLSEGGYGTFCSPYDVPDVSTAGAKFYSLTGKVLNGDKTQLAGIVLSEDPETELVAGHSYFYQVDAGSSAINLTGCMNHVTHAWENGADGFVGCLVDDNGGKTYVPDGVERINGNYILQSGKLRYVAAGTTASIRAYRAYINVGELEDVDAKSVPKRRIVRAEDFTGEVGMEDTATGIDELTENSVINWNEPVYNIMGMRVGKGATGVLIQNGHKFFVK
jgi:hypothetical protein